MALLARWMVLIGQMYCMQCAISYVLDARMQCIICWVRYLVCYEILLLCIAAVMVHRENASGTGATSCLCGSCTFSRPIVALCSMSCTSVLVMRLC